MNINFELIIIITAVVAAATYFLFTVIRQLVRKDGCQSCQISGKGCCHKEIMDYLKKKDK